VAIVPRLTITMPEGLEGRTCHHDIVYTGVAGSDGATRGWHAQALPDITGEGRHDNRTFVRRTIRCGGNQTEKGGTPASAFPLFSFAVTRA
jgi:hypothetical protein